ncbi:cyclic nucleotide-binding domain-containing protein [Aneurinibacillus uraniidurans]|uniref:cyclic nucleotide-binding domain-containing protein n=1 Tax=Aneurinibacillus uraniidurans TaxID=2966586 RepID=UPI0023499CD1|nr:cyclic nucleotide-binding domain-containing protein [Aneurinibacillus sp. B1]WCN38477.1 cyclic nucleotide-binding domain-containing protein [Aneurinibacillus sp. B1]
MDKLTFLDIPLFQDLDRVHKATLLPEFTQRSFHRGEILFEEGEFGDCLYIIMQGSVRIFLQEDGKERTLALLKEKEYFGEMALLTGDPRSASAKAEEDVVVLHLSKEQFDRLLLTHNALAVQFAGILARRLAAVNRQQEQTPSLPSSPAHQEAAATRKESQLPRKSTVLLETQKQGTPSAFSMLKLMLWLGTLLVGTALYGGLLYFHIPYHVSVIATVLCTGFLLVALRLTSLIMMAVTMSVVTVCLGITSPNEVLSTFSEPPIITALALALIAQIVFQTGILQRIVLILASKLPEPAFLYIALVRFAAVLAALIVPSSRLRSEAFGLLLAKERSDSLAASYTFLFMTSSAICLFTLALIPETQQHDPSFAIWLRAALPLALAFALVQGLAFLVRKRTVQEQPAFNRQLIQNQLDVIGPWTSRETIALSLMVLMTAGFFAAPYLNISIFWIVMAACIALFALIGSTPEAARELRYSSFIVFGLFVSMAGTMRKTGWGEAIIASFMSNASPFWYVIGLFISIYVFRQFVPAMLAVLLGMVSFGSLALAAGVHPVVVALTAVMASSHISSSIASLWEQRGRDIWRNGAIACVALIITLPVWQMMQLVPQEKRVAPVLSSASIQQIHAVFPAYLPADKTAAQSFQRGIELALQVTKRTKANETPSLQPLYIESGKHIPTSEQPFSFAIAASMPDSFPGTLPVVATDHRVQSQTEVISLSIQPEAYARSTLAFLQRNGHKNIAIYYEESAAGRQFASTLEKMAEQNGMIVTDRMVSTASHSLLGQTLHKWTLLQTDIGIVFDSTGESAARFVSEAQSARSTLPLVVASDSFPNRGATLPHSAATVYVMPDYDPFAQRTPTRAFVEQYQKAYGVLPDRFAAIGYDACMLMAHAVSEAKSSDPTRIRNVLRQIERWEGAVRTYSFATTSDADSLTVKAWLQPDGGYRHVQERGNE